MPFLSAEGHVVPFINKIAFQQLLQYNPRVRLGELGSASLPIAKTRARPLGSASHLDLFKRHRGSGDGHAAFQQQFQGEIGSNDDPLDLSLTAHRARMCFP